MNDKTLKMMQRKPVNALSKYKRLALGVLPLYKKVYAHKHNSRPFRIALLIRHTNENVSDVIFQNIICKVFAPFRVPYSAIIYIQTMV